MRLILIYFSFFLFFPQITLSNINKPLQNFSGCVNEVSEVIPKKFDSLKIDKIEIDVHNYRNWIVNSVRILTSRSRYVSENFKQRYDATVLVKYSDGTKCMYSARIRHHGDEKDHIDLLGNTIIQSIDVHLEVGNIKGITRFKLLRPNTRGRLADEIFLTELLRNLNYLAPRTAKVDARINKANSTMIFQEKAAKELLEYNNRREGPILEGDERFFFKAVEKLPSNQKSNWEIGVVPIMNNSIKHLLAKQVNSNIINKSEGLKKMSFNATTNLNLIYLYYSNKFQDEKNNFHYFDYDLDNTLLGFFDPKNILKLDIYNLLIQATNSQHGLAANNRKFYWNSLENYFEPINYDSNPNIVLNNPTTTTVAYRLPISENFFSSFNSLKIKLKNTNKEIIKNNINLSGLNISSNEVSSKINRIIENLNRIEKVYQNINDDELLEHNRFKPIENILKKFNDTLNDIDSNVMLVKQNAQNGSLQRCRIFLSSCQDYNFTQNDLTDLLEGELVLNENLYQYLGNTLNFENIKKYRNFNKMKFGSSTLYFEDGIIIKPNYDNLNLKIIQTEVGSRAYFIGGNLKNFNIQYQGQALLKNNTPKNYPNDMNGLTGCLSFINLSVENIVIDSKNTNCEDAINFINTTGQIKKITIENSFSDGLDVDFSNLHIDKIFINSSKNDCVDFSAGEYKLDLLILNNCGDKALSAGESSTIYIKYIEGKNSQIGIASKDSSTVFLNNLNFNNVKSCLSAYNKKQEFNGGIIKFENEIICNNFVNKFEIDKFSEITKQGKFNQ